MISNKYKECIKLKLNLDKHPMSHNLSKGHQIGPVKLQKNENTRMKKMEYYMDSSRVIPNGNQLNRSNLMKTRYNLMREVKAQGMPHKITK